MGWVTLTLRKRELKQEHAYYQLRDLQISRAKRQLARSKSAGMASIQANQTKDVNAIKEQYDYSGIMEKISTLRKSLGSSNDFGEKVSSGSAKVGGSTYTDYGEYKTAIDNAIADKQQEYQKTISDRTEAINDTKTMYDQQKADLEQEVSDQETELDMEQVEVEAQMEAISAEIQAVSDAISSEIQASTIKLA